MVGSLWWITASWACSPPMARALCVAPDDQVWIAPIADFEHELQPLLPAVRYESADLGVAEAEEDDLRAAGVDGFDIDAWRAWRAGERPDRPELPQVPPAVVTYAETARAWHHGDRAAAFAAFERMAGDPSFGERALWAAHTVAVWDDDRSQLRVLALVDGGVPDRLGLAAFALGERARLRLSRGDWRGAVDLYLAQLATGSSSAGPSLDLVVRQARDSGAFGRWAADPVLRPVATAWILAHGGPSPDPGEVDRTRAWLIAVEGAGDAVLPEADHLAWAAYQVGDTDTASRWLDRSAQTPLASWIRGKLLLRAGQLEEGERLLAVAAEGFGASETWPRGDMGRYDGGDGGEGITPNHEAWAEAGVVRLARGDFPGAFEAFVAADSWADAAYLTERVLTVDEARALVSGLGPWTSVPIGELRGLAPTSAEERAGGLRYLLARRLLREGRDVDATAWFQPELRPYAIRWTEDRRLWQGEGPEGRAGALWDAALLARKSGLELFGTELEPDFAMYQGDYAAIPRPTERADLAGPTLLPTAAEQARVAASAPKPDARWHYRTIAADLAATAAAALPDDDPRMPILLCRASTWMMNRDPDVAQRWYREVFRRGADWPGDRCGDVVFVRRTGRWVGSVAIACGLFAILALSAIFGVRMARRR